MKFLKKLFKRKDTEHQESHAQLSLKLYQLSIENHELRMLIKSEQFARHQSDVQSKQAQLIQQTRMGEQMVSNLNLMAQIVQLKERLAIIESVQEGMLPSKKGGRL